MTMLERSNFLNVVIIGRQQLQERDESVEQRSDRTEILAARSALTIGDSRRSTSDRPGMTNARQFLQALNRTIPPGAERATCSGVAQLPSLAFTFMPTDKSD
jgi:hypothetical protein